MRLVRIAGAIAGAILAVAVAFLAVNQFDEALDPAAAAFYASGEMPPLHARSGFALVAGFTAPRDQEPRQWAVGWTRDVAGAVQSKQPMPVRKDALRIQGAAELRCMPETGDCIDLYSRKPAVVDEMALDNALLLRRYDELLAQVDVAEAGLTGAQEAPIVDYNAIVQTHGLFLSRIAVRVAAGDREGALESLERDASFQRRAIAQGRTLIAKMVGARLLSRDLLLAAQVARRMGDAPPAQWRLLRAVAKPIAPAEMGLGAPMRFEGVGIRDFVTRVRLMDRKKLSREMGFTPLAADLMKLALTNATLNYAYRRFVPWEQLDDVPSHLVEARIAVLKEETKRLAQPDWTWFYNPAGKGIATEGANEWDFDRYVLRLRDIDALARLACSVIAVREQGIAAGKVAEYLATAEPGCGDPYTAKPMAWNSGKGVLWFAPRDHKNVERFGGRDGRIEIAPY